MPLLRKREAGDDDQFVPRNLDIEILQIMFTRAFDNDGIAHKRGIISRRFSSLGIRPTPTLAELSKYRHFSTAGGDFSFPSLCR